MLVCDGSKRWRRHGRRSRAESQFGGFVPSFATRVIGPVLLHSVKIGTNRSGLHLAAEPQGKSGNSCRRIGAELPCHGRWLQHRRAT
jgi:hypothetical protein